MNVGFDLLKKHLASPYPTGYRGVDIKGIDLVMLDADTVGCITTYYGRFGDVKKLDPKRQNILKLCRDELTVVVEETESYAKEYFQNLLTLTSIVLEELSHTRT